MMLLLQFNNRVALSSCNRLASSSEYLVGWVQDSSTSPSQWAVQSYFPNESDLDLVSECISPKGPIHDVIHNAVVENQNVYFCYDTGICRCAIVDGVFDTDVDVSDWSQIVTGTFLALSLPPGGEFLYALEHLPMGHIAGTGISDGWGCYVHTYAIDADTGELDYLGRSDAAYDAVTLYTSPDGKCIYLPASDASAIAICTVGDDGIAKEVNQDGTPGLYICPSALDIKLV